MKHVFAYLYQFIFFCFSVVYAQEAPLNIPFADDFSYGGKEPADSLWMELGGTHVNNNYGYDQPSAYVLSFNGLDYDGNPYDFRPFSSNASSEISGNTDTLISRPIDLSNLSLDDDVALSFFYQKGGISNALIPESTDRDSMRIFFLRSDSTYEKVWPRPSDIEDMAVLDEQINEGSLQNFPFIFTSIMLNDSTFFHSKFQFKFETFGVTTGNWDNWNIDMVYLDSGRTNPVNLEDVGYYEEPSHLFSEYRAVPYYQFISDPGYFLADSLTASLKNSGVDPLPPIINDSTILIRELTTNTDIVEFSTDYEQLLNNGSIDPGTKITFTNTYNQDAYINTVESLDPENNRFIFSTLYKSKIPEGSDYFPANNSISVQNTVDSYYAYDDGTWETAFGINGYGFLAYEFELLQPDTLTAYALVLPKLGLDYTDFFLNLRVWTSLKGVDGSTEDNRVGLGYLTVDYDSTQYRYMKYIFDEPIILPAGKFYLGYEQVADEDQSIVLGYDLNSSSEDKIYFKGSNASSWTSNPNPIEGALMIRPYFGERGKIVGIKKPKSKKVAQLFIYPNPSEGIVSLANDLDILEVYDASGRLLFSFSDIKQGKSIDLSPASGILFLKGINGNQLFSGRIIIR